MKLATFNNNTADGQLVVISNDGARFAPAGTSMQAALENWASFEASLEAISTALNNGTLAGQTVQTTELCAPLPRAWQWLDGSVYKSHADLMGAVTGMEVKTLEGRPLMYQGLSDTFLSATADVPMASEADGIDFEGEFGIIVDEVPMGVTPEQARQHIKLIVQINDWSLRAYSGPEISTGFGWIHAKPPCSVAPFAVTPEELGEHWENCQVQLRLNVEWNGKKFGHAHGGHMQYGFDELVAHAARTRSLVAGTVIGSGTVSNDEYREVGSSCIAERRGIELLDQGEAKTGFMHYGDTVRMEARTPADQVVFGAIEQKVTQPGS
ncbi:Fumarylacetoacetate (FAA) hydrolase [Alteromonas sp. 38]|uniref:fumarylacetoacetate hydrolase family protein n=1 Tax=Alteromonas TaxID=226 RepID=UPI0012F3AFA9|nr:MULTISPECIES: fumarylacetoacetate hydrolase family protein [Alteromonas]CAD5274334.1 Fumarylacetoacetate (FAA) hydrolase [Alteromonas sp. 154]VXB60309.1 Fumarylacetoacetate (FAA) hydrolase [Alteromonas sp. 38]